MRKSNIFRQKNKKAFSLVEILVSMGIMGIVLAMFSNVLVSTIKVSIIVSERSQAREELSALVATIKRDIRNADLIVDCGDTSSAGSLEECEIQSATGFVWSRCSFDNMRACKVDSNSGEILYSSSDNISIEKLAFEPGFEATDSDTRRNLLITIIASHPNQNLGIENMVSQTSISTRNYGVVALGTPRATAPVCGNYVIEAGEECDDGNKTNGDGCSSVCKREAICGNGIVESGEQCDGGFNCRPDCILSVCNNGVVEPGEQCDSTPNCSSTCRLLPVCGNGILESGEECDDNNINAYDGCGNTCLIGIAPYNVCSGVNGWNATPFKYVRSGSWLMNIRQQSGRPNSYVQGYLWSSGVWSTVGGTRFNFPINTKIININVSPSQPFWALGVGGYNNGFLCVEISGYRYAR